MNTECSACPLKYYCYHDIKNCKCKPSDYDKLVRKIQSETKQQN